MRWYVWVIKPVNLAVSTALFWRLDLHLKVFPGLILEVRMDVSRERTEGVRLVLSHLEEIIAFDL